MKVNYQGTVNVIDACKKHGIKKIVMSSSPSTRLDGNDINGLKETELKIPRKFLQAYAESKCKGEEACMAVCDGENLLTVAVAPHQCTPARYALPPQLPPQREAPEGLRRRREPGERLLRR